MQFSKILLAFAAVVTFAGSVSAAPVVDMGIIAGYRLNDGDATAANASVDAVGTLQFGGLAFLPINDKFIFRTGFIYAQRHFEVSNVDAEFAHFDIPLTFMYRIGDLGGVFAGPGLALKISDDCGGNDCTGSKSTLMPISLGGHFKIAPQFAGEVYYEMVSGRIANALEDTRAVGANLIVTFE